MIIQARGADALGQGGLGEGSESGQNWEMFWRYNEQDLLTG